MSDFLRKLSILLRNIFTKKALIYIIIFLLMIILRTSKSNAFSESDLSYSGFPSDKMSSIYNFIQNNKGSYDSVFVAYGWADPNTYPAPEKRLHFFFYNFEDNGYLYKEINNGNYNNYIIYSHYSVSNSVHRISCDYDNLTPYSDLYSDSVYISIRDFGTGYKDSSKPSTFATNRSIYADSSFLTIWFQASDVPITNLAPYIINYESISSWNFNTMNIGGYVLVPDTQTAIYSYTLYSVINNGDYTSSLNVKPYSVTVDNGNHIQLNVPRQQLLSNYNLNPNDTIHFILRVRLDYRGQSITDNYDLGTYTIGVTQSEADNINANSNRQQLQNIENGIDNLNINQQETTQAVEDNTQAVQENTEATQHLENTITDDTVTSTASDLPSTDVQDSTQNGIDNIFQSIYNAFCTGEAQDIIFPIPFTNKNITLSPYYVRDMLNNNGASWVYLLIQAFWGYLIGRYIVKDISHKITKIKSGDIENIENNNIKEEML